MTDKSDQKTMTFFNRDAIYSRGTEHAMRLPFIAVQFKDAAGEPYFERMVPSETPDRRIEAVKAFAELLGQNSTQTGFLGELMLAVNQRLWQFAVNDTEEASRLTGEFIYAAFEAAKATGRDFLQKDCRHLLGALADNAAFPHYEEQYGAHASIPLERNTDLFIRLYRLDPSAAQRIFIPRSLLARINEVDLSAE